MLLVLSHHFHSFFLLCVGTFVIFCFLFVFILVLKNITIIKQVDVVFFVICVGELVISVRVPDSFLVYFCVIVHIVVAVDCYVNACSAVPVRFCI